MRKLFTVRRSKNYLVGGGFIRGNGDSTYTDTKCLYDELFARVIPSYPYLVNCHNFIQDIGKNYSEFNRGRRECFSQYGYTGKPSACALGTPKYMSPGTYVKFIASKIKPTEIENPRQVPAYNYPAQYGAPLFSRAVSVDGQLYISGTASIVGSDTLHVGDVLQQFIETCENLRSIMGNFTFDDFNFITYVKYAKDVALIKAFSPFVSNYVVCDICRDDLLVEVEAVTKNGKQIQKDFFV